MSLFGVRFSTVTKLLSSLVALIRGILKSHNVHGAGRRQTIQASVLSVARGGEGTPIQTNYEQKHLMPFLKHQVNACKQTRKAI